MRNHFNQLMLVVGLAFLLSPTYVFAQGQIFTDIESWTAAVSGTQVDAFEEFVDSDGELLADLPNSEVVVIPDQSTSYGTVTQENSDGIQFTQFSQGPDLDDFAGVFIGTDQTVNFEFNGEAGPVAGFWTEIIAFPLDFRFQVFDGETVITDMVIANSATDPREDFRVVPFGWVNTDGANVTRIEFSVLSDIGGVIGAVGQLQFSFDDPPEPAEPTCFEQLAETKANLSTLIDSLSGNDRYLAESAFDCICWMQNDDFWVQPSGDRLTQYGGTLFIGAAYTIAYLEWVDDPGSDLIIDELIGVLDCLVDNEIAYAIANDGNQSFIERAEDFAELGDIIDDDFDNEVVAALAYRLAWLHAFYSTY